MHLDILISKTENANCLSTICRTQEHRLKIVPTEPITALGMSGSRDKQFAKFKTTRTNQMSLFSHNMICIRAPSASTEFNFQRPRIGSPSGAVGARDVNKRSTHETADQYFLPCFSL